MDGGLGGDKRVAQELFGRPTVSRCLHEAPIWIDTNNVPHSSIQYSENRREVVEPSGGSALEKRGDNLHVDEILEVLSEGVRNV